jgi:hypothetical protein
MVTGLDVEIYDFAGTNSADDVAVQFNSVRKKSTSNQ